MKTIITIMIILGPLVSFAETISLDHCQELARENYPLYKNTELYREINEKKIENLRAGKLPEVSLFGVAQYQSDVTKIDIDIPNLGSVIPEIKNDQYKIGMNINQLIWDGGVIDAREEIELTNSKINISGTETELFGIREKVNTTFFNILMTDERIKSIRISRMDLEAQKKVIDSRVKAGYLLESYSNIILAELLKLEQALLNMSANRAASLDVLSELTGLEFNADDSFELPDIKDISLDVNNRLRPEYKQFDEGRNKLDQSKALVSSGYLPKISAFAQTAYGRPGLNMFEPDFQPYFIVGLKANWTILNWGKSGREHQALELQKQVLENSEETFTKGIRIKGIAILRKIEILQKQIETDKEIISLRDKISKEADSQMRNGIITSSEYLNEFNAAAQARLDRSIRIIELAREKVKYLDLLGNNK